MEEQTKNETVAPRYALRLEDLRGWHRLKITCFKCRRESLIDPKALRERYSGHQRVMELEGKFRCAGCGNRYGNSVTVGRVSRS